MRITKKVLNTAILAGAALLLTAGVASAQNVVNLKAAQQSTTLPDGNAVPMWGWTCGAAVTGSAATCSALTYNTTTGVHNPQTGGTTWQPPLIVVPYVAPSTAAPNGTTLTINLTNSLPVETSLAIIGQTSASTTATNGGMGAPVREAGPRTDGAHAGQTATTWTTVIPGSFTPPTQGERIRSFVPEVAGVGTVGAAPTVGTYSWTNLKPGTYLMRTGTYPSIQGPMGLYGVLVVTTAPVEGTSPGLAYPVKGAAVGGVTYDADVVVLESELDPRQNNMVAALFPTVPGGPSQNAGFSETMKWTPACGAAVNSTLTISGAAPTCYPPAVDYTPLYFFVNGLSFSKQNQAASALSIPATGTTGNVLVRFVNAGSHMHVPTVNGLNMLLVAEDGYVLPDVALALAPPAPTVAKTLTAKTVSPPLGLQLRNEVFQAAGKVYDVLVSPTQQTKAGTYDSAIYGIFDRSLALSTNSQRDGGMQVILDVNDPAAAKLSAASASAAAVANPDSYAYAPGVTLTVSDPGKGVIANDLNVSGVQLSTLPSNGTVTLYPNGTFTYVPTGTGADSFGYCANGAASGTAGLCTTVSLNKSSTVCTTPGGGGCPTANPDSYTSVVSSLLSVAAPGVLGNDVDPNHYPMTAALVTKAQAFLTVHLNPDGSFTVTKPAASACPVTGCTFTYKATNSQNSASNIATVTLNFLPGSNLSVKVQDAKTQAPLTDYKWIIEQDLTFQIDPRCQQNGAGGTKPPTCPTAPVPPTLATNFHTSYMPVIATGCTGPQSCGRGQTVYDNNPASGTYQQHVAAACDGYGICVTGALSLPATSPGQVNLSAKNPDGSPASYYISILPGDAANPFNTGNSSDPTVPGNCIPGTTPTGQSVNSNCGHTMGGSPIVPTITGTGATATATFPNTVVVNVEPNPLRTTTITAFVFEDDFPTNGEPDTGGGVDSFPTEEAPLEDFQMIIWDLAGSVSGDPTGQMTYDMFNMPLSNALNGTIDPLTGLNACPIAAPNPTTGNTSVGVMIVCPKYESDGKTLSPIVGQMVVKNLMPGLYDVTMHPGAAREARGEEWLQTNTLDGSHLLDAFVKSAEPAYFQEYGPGGYHVFFGEVNPKIVNARLPGVCSAAGAPPCHNTVKGQTVNLHQGRSPDERLFTSAVFPQGDPRNYAMFNYTQCFATLGDTDGLTFALAKCDPDGNFTFTGIPDGNWAVTVFDMWDDLLVDGSSRSITVTGGNTGTTLNMEYGSFSWQSHLWTNTYMDTNGNGVQDPGEPGLLQVPSRIRMRNGKFNNFLLSDLNGQAHFDETFPLFNWYVVESDTTRFRSTGVHVVNDAGGQVDGPSPAGNGVTTDPYQAILNSIETFSLPTALRTPGAVYCGRGDPQCATTNFSNTTGAGIAGSTGGPVPSGPCTATNTSGCISTGRIDPGTVVAEGWQGGVSEFNLVDWGKLPYLPGETGGIVGHVVNATTRPFNDPTMVFQNLWEPLVPRVQINLYAESAGPDGTPTLTLVDTTTTSSWDDWSQGFRADGTPNMSCPGEDANDPFFSYTMAGTPNYLSPNTTIPNNSQYKCFDGYHNLNQMQPAAYDGRYQFPSAYCANNPGGTNPGTGIKCATVPNPALSAAVHTGATPAVLPPGKYVVEEITPHGYELNKEEDLNLLIGDNYIAPAANQFMGLANIYIVPDQASIDAYDPSYTGPTTTPFTAGDQTILTGTSTGFNNGSSTTNLGRNSFGSFGPGGLIQQPAPCVGLMRVVPDFLSISPESGEVAPFAGSTRPLCDRREVTLGDQMQANTDFFIWTKTPAASHFTGFISDDFASEFDPSAPAFGEKFAVVNVPVGVKDYNGLEISRVYADQWGTFNGLVYSTWQVDPPNITGYSPNVMIFCMNDPGPIPDPAHPGQKMTDPYYNSNYSDFCYEWSLMPGDTAYLDTPVVPTSAFAEGYDGPDCAYPDATPAVKEVDGDGIGPWVSAPGKTITITALGDQMVANHAYAGPAENTAPYNQKTINRHYGFGAGAKVTIGGANATCTGGDLSMTCTVPAGVPLCKANNPTYTGANATARCGELVITAANGKQSVDTVTVTIGGKAPTHVSASGTIQSAIDAAAPGDLIIVDPTCTTATGLAAACTTPSATNVHASVAHNEMLLMWKPVRLQGVAAASVIVDANTQPAGQLLQPWRAKVNCLFGLAMNGGFINTSGIGVQNPYDPSNTYTCNFATPQVDPIPLEPVVGWDASLNGNIAELLQEPTLMGAYEGAAITVLGKGLEDINTTNCNATANAGCITLNNITGTTTNDGFNNGLGDCNPSSPFYGSNYLCNPSRIDGMTFRDSSQGGGGIFLHGWNHYTEVANNRIYNNGGTLAGGIVVGQAETPPETIDAAGTQLPFLLNHDVNIHHNSVTQNTAYGDELNSNTPAAAGGVTFCDGTDYYKFNYNWVCGNLSMGDGGGVAHFGFSYNGHIEHNTIIFNQSTNPTLTTYGGGLIAEGVGPDGTVCENSATVDVDCPPQLPNGVGPGLVINANLLMGNTAEGGSGGGLRLQKVNGTDVQRNPSHPEKWYEVTVTNNIIANNVAGWGGGGVSILDSLRVNFINNTVASNDTTATAGILFDTNVAPNGNVPPPGCDPTLVPPPAACGNGSVTTSNFMVAGLQVDLNSGQLTGVMTNASVVCPAHPNCLKISNPVLENNLFLQNRSFHITTGAIPAPGLETTVQLVPALQQLTTGACPTNAPATYWDLGVYGDTCTAGGICGSNHASGYTLSPKYSILTDPADYPSANNRGVTSSTVVHPYCNGSRVPPEIVTTLCGPAGSTNANAPGCVQPGTVGVGITVPPGITDSTYAGPAFSLTPAATVDEGSNWVNMFYGPLSLSNATIPLGGTGYGVLLGNYTPAAGSNAIDVIPASSPTYNHAPSTDFFGNPRPDARGSAIDIGAVEVGPPLSDRDVLMPAAWTPTAPRGVGQAGPIHAFLLTNRGNEPSTGIAPPTLSGANAADFGIVRMLSTCGPAGTGQLLGQTSLRAGESCMVTVQFRPTTGKPGTRSATLSVTDSGGTQTATLTGKN
jgi:hypothetical protein